MDAFSEVLSGVRLTGAMFFSAEFSAPWRLSTPHCRVLASTLAPRLPASNFRCEPVEAMTFDDGCADVVISSAVLHFARDEAHFRAMLAGTLANFASACIAALLL